MEIIGVKQCPLVAVFEEIRTGGLATDPDNDAGIVFLGGGDTSMVFNESDYWLATRLVVAVRGQLEDRTQEIFDRLFPNGKSTGHDLMHIIMRESPVVRQLQLLKPVLESLAASIIMRINTAAIRGESINVSIGNLPEYNITETDLISGVINQYVDFANSLDITAFGGSRQSAIAHMSCEYIPTMMVENVTSIHDGISADKKIAEIGKIHENIHAEATHKLNEIFVFCKEVVKELL